MNIDFTERCCFKNHHGQCKLHPIKDEYYCYPHYRDVYKHPYNKDSVPTKIRDALWEKYSDGKGNAACFVCKCVVDKHGDNAFHASHVVARSRGGPATLSNLRVCCRACNLDMGTENLLSYKNRYDNRGCVVM